MRLRAFTIYVWWLVSAVTSSGQILAGGGLAQMGWLSETTIASGLKEALRVGIEHAVNVMGSPNGYFRNQVIKILRPEPVQVVEKGLRAVGYDPHVDEFVFRSPGAGTSRLARCVTITFLEMSVAEAIETISVHCVAGRTGARTTLATTRPSRARLRQSRMWG